MAIGLSLLISAWSRSPVESLQSSAMVSYSGCCRTSRPESSGFPQLLTHRVHQDGQILQVSVSHQGRTYVGALILESRWLVCLLIFHNILPWCRPFLGHFE